jgi:hypothetical protein
MNHTYIAKEMFYMAKEMHDINQFVYLKAYSILQNSKYPLEIRVFAAEMVMSSWYHVVINLNSRIKNLASFPEYVAGLVGAGALKTFPIDVISKITEIYGVDENMLNEGSTCSFKDSYIARNS